MENFLWISSAARPVVHTSVRHPKANGPCNSIFNKVSFCGPLIFGGRPEALRTFSPSSPCASHRSRHRITELTLHPTRRAISLRDRTLSAKHFDCTFPSRQQDIRGSFRPHCEHP